MTESSSNLYESYAYSYPHKSAYRQLSPPVDLGSVWGQEKRDALFLYVHIPFCNMRCGFCNLFTQARPRPTRVSDFLTALKRQFRSAMAVIEPVSFARGAIGGGTPTFLEPKELEDLFDLCESAGLRPEDVPVSVETSPETATPDRLLVLQERGVDRVSMGVQSFVESECRGVGRPQSSGEVHRALQAIRASSVRIMNLDLIYGLPGQTLESWEITLAACLEYMPEEIYLYPLYTRPVTALGRKEPVNEDLRLPSYRVGRDLLLAGGYVQESMRFFRRAEVADEGPVYCCQEDGMVGMGCGARSYTRQLHYSEDYAVRAPVVREIIDQYLGRDEEYFRCAHYGVRLGRVEEQRRWLLKSLLRVEGAAVAQYRAQFGSDMVGDFPELTSLEDRGWLDRKGERLRLTPDGIERSDLIGPLLFSAEVKNLMRAQALR